MLKSSIKEKKMILPIKLTKEEKKQLQEKADKYTGGNVSAWVRYAAIKLEPKSADLHKEK